MRSSIASLLAIFIFATASPLAANKDTTGTDILRRMHKAFYQGPCRQYTFSQKNTHYRNDSVTGNSVWHEAIGFPDRFRINYGDTASGNFVVFRNDSAFHYKAGKRVKERADQNTLLLLLGGMYYRSLEDVLARLKAKNYNLDSYSEQSWMGAPVYVIGAQKDELTDNQVWVDKKTLRVLRIIEKRNEQDMMDIRFESHQKWCQGFVETKVSFRRNGKLEQLEEYYNIKKAEGFPLD